jgi:hypothetical protein
MSFASAVPAMAIENGESCSRPSMDTLQNISHSMNERIGQQLKLPMSMGPIEEPPLIKVKIDFSPDAYPTNITVADVDNAQERAMADSYVAAIKKAAPYKELLVMCYDNRRSIKMQFDSLPVMY